MRWYFDFISPYAYLQSTRLTDFAEQQKLECVPVLFAGLLEHWENIGPAEIEPKRKWTFRNTLWLAQRDNIPLKLPRHHPFNPLPLLRLSIVHGNQIEVVQRLFNFVWAEGDLPQDEDAFAKLLNELGTKPEQLSDATVKNALRQNGERAINAGVFGVPTVEINGDLIWGYDATEMALAAAQETKDYQARHFASADSLPQGTTRNRSKERA